MGLLRNVRENDGIGAGTIIFWALVGSALGTGLPYFAGLPAGAVTVAATIGGGLGICVGFYAGFGASKLARLLAFPGLFMGF